MPRPKIDRTLISLRLPTGLLAEVDDRAKAAGLSRSQWIQNRLAADEPRRSSPMAEATDSKSVRSGFESQERHRSSYGVPVDPKVFSGPRPKVGKS